MKFEKELPLLLTFNETKEFLRIGRNNLLFLLQTGEIPGIKIAGKWRVRREDLLEYLEEQF